MHYCALLCAMQRFWIVIKLMVICAQPNIHESLYHLKWHAFSNFGRDVLYVQIKDVTHPLAYRHIGTTPFYRNGVGALPCNLV